jgi:outer membrane protein assembly factor BamD (BamD/ComL family)
MCDRVGTSRNPFAARGVRIMLSSAFPLTLLVLIAAVQSQQYREREVLDPATDEWLAQVPEPAGTPAAELDRARELLVSGAGQKAAKLLKEWVEHNADHERYYEGVYLLGDAYFESGDYWKALERYKQVAEGTSGELFFAANRRSIDVARAFLAGRKRIVLGFLRLSAYSEGLDALSQVWERVPGTRMGETALKLRADYYYANGDMLLAEDEYAHIAREYPSGRYVQFAMLRAAEAAEAAFPGVKFDDRSLLDADERYRQVQNTFPEYAARENVDERLEGIRRQRAAKDFEVARWYERTRRTDAAEFYYRQILKDWPDTLAATEARQRLRALGFEAEGEAAQP